MPAVVLVIAAMCSVQVGNALSVPVFDSVGPFGAAWLRLCWASLFLLAIVRPRLRTLDADQRRAAFALGAVTGVMTVAYAGAIDRIPLGTASAIEFLGPLGVAVATRTSGRAGVLVPVLAAVGVAALTEPWRGATDGIGVLLALVAAAAWAAYILLTQRVGTLLPGLTGLALSFPAAALVTAPLGLTQAAGGLEFEPVAQMAGIAVLLPLVPFALELLALRRLRAAVFGILMCLEPAIGLLAGLVMLDQHPRVIGLLGLACVVIAGAWASGARE